MRAFHWSLDVSALAIKRETQQRLVEGHPDLSARTLMVGLTRPDSGEVRYRGVRYTELLRPARVVGSVLDARSMHPGRTARNHLHAIAHLSGIPRRRVAEVLH